MSLREIHSSSASVFAATILIFLSGMALPASAGQAQQNPIASSGTGGLATLASAPASPGSVEALANVDLATGAAQMSLPFQLPKARGNAQPSLALTYSSSAGVGFAGVGWTLNTPSFVRKGASGMPKFVDDTSGADVTGDTYLFAGKPLVPICAVTPGGGCDRGIGGETFPASFGAWTYFRAESDDGDRYLFSPDHKTWVIQSKSGSRLEFGEPLDHATPGALERADVGFMVTFDQSGEKQHTDINDIYGWNLARQYDASGNIVVYQWGQFESWPTCATQCGVQFLQDIYDTPAVGAGGPGLTGYAHHTHLNWSAADEQSAFAAAQSAMGASSPVWRAQPYRRLIGVDVTSQPMTPTSTRQLVRRYHLGYSWNPSHTRASLHTFQIEGTCGANNAINEDASTGLLPDATACGRLPPTTLEYFPWPATAHGEILGSSAAGNHTGFSVADNNGTGFGIVDVSGNGRPPLLYTEQAFSNEKVQVVQTLSGSSAVARMQDHNVPRQALIADIAPGSTRAVFGDWFGDGRVNVLWLDVTASTSTGIANNLYEIYSLNLLPPPGNGEWRGQGPFPIPKLFANTSFVADYQNGRAMDVDGDGLTDMGFVDDLEVEVGTGAMRSYFSQRDRRGAIIPFGSAGQRVCVPDGSYPAAYHNPAHRVMADMDADGILDMVALEAIPDDGVSTFGTSIVAHTYKGRGDGRFGIFGAPLPLQAGHCGDPTFAVKWKVESSHRWDGIMTSGIAALHDLDGDGVADLIAVTASGIDVIFHAHDATGTGDFDVQGSDVFIPAAKFSWTGAGAFDASRVQLQFADLDGSGVDELVVIDDIVKPGTSWAIDYATEQRGTSGGTRAGLLQAVSNGVGATTTLSYKSVASLAATMPALTGTTPQPAWVVSNVTSTNGLASPHGQTRAMDYAYESAVYDAREHAFLGFKRVTATPLITDDAAPAVKTRTTFTTDTCSVAAATPCAPMADYWYRMRRGQPAAIEEFGVASTGITALSTTVNTYPIAELYVGLDGRHVRRTWLGTTDTYLWDPSKQASTLATLPIMVGSDPALVQQIPISLPTAAKHLRHSSHFNALGNQDVSIDWGDVDADRPIVTTSEWRLPASDLTSWSFRNFKQVVGYGDGGGNMLPGGRETDFDYEPHGLLTLVTAPLTGTLPLDRAAMGAPAPADASHDTASLVRMSASYDLSGNVSDIRLPNGKCTRVTYDAAYNQLPIETSVFRNGCGNGALTTSRAFDRGLEVVTTELSPAMHMTMAAYDGFGRVVEVDQPDGDASGHTAAAPALKVDYALADTGPIRKIHVSRVDGQAGQTTYDESWLYVDAFGRSLFSLRQAESGWVVEGMAALTTTGRIANAFQSFFFAGSDGSSHPTNALPTVPAQSFTYDAFGRLLTSTGFDGKFTAKLTYSALELSTKIQDGEQGINAGAVAHAAAFTKVFSDGHGRTTRSVRHLTSPSDDVVTASAFLATGELLSIQQSHSAGTDQFVRWMAYDSLGRVVLNAEPNTSVNMGVTPGVIPANMKAWRYAYNDSNELVGTSDARGCGENFIHDQVGRLVAEDYSPCTATQPAYTPANASTGEGTEAFYVYDVAEITQGVDPASYVGELTATYDRAQHSQLVLDARGRVVQVARQIAKPDAGSLALSSRYAPHTFKKTVRAYDERNRVVALHTGADLPELAPPGVGSIVTTSYTPRGTIASVTSTYGPLLTSQTIDAKGALLQQVFGDVAGTTGDYNYFPNGLLAEASMHRRNGPWVPASTTYTPPLATDPNTLQGELTHVQFTFDAVGNPLTTSDTSDPAQWPAGTKPVSLQTMKYDDTYRLGTNLTSYAGGDDAFVPPFQGDPTYPPTGRTPNRVRSQTFQYDWLGNTQSSDDDAHIFADRSYGAVTNGAMGAAHGPHQLVSTAAAGGSTIQTAYDGAGNLTTLTVARGKPCSVGCTTYAYQYEWDEVGRLSTARRLDGGGKNPHQAVSLRYVYDADGNRVVRARDDQSSSGVAYSVEVFDSLRLDHASYPDVNGDYERTSSTESVYLISNGARVAHVVYARNDLPTGTSGRLHVLFEFGNYLGSTSFVVDRDTSELVERATYQAYGGADSDYRTSRWDNFHEQVGYSGKEDDSEVGLTYFGARYYMPAIGRWASADPLTVHALGSDLNPYAYVLGSPTRLTDPSGLDTGPPGCDNLSPGCSNGGWGDLGNLFGGGGGAGAGGGGGGGGTIGNNGQRGGAGGGSTQPLLAGPAFSNIFDAYAANPGAFTVDQGAVRGFNAGVDRHATVIAGAGVLAVAQVAVVASLASVVDGIWTTATAISRGAESGWTALAQQLSAKAPWAISVATAGTNVATALNGNSTLSSEVKAAEGAEAAVARMATTDAESIANQIANGHAFGKHVVQQGEFPMVSTVDQFAQGAKNVLLSPETQVRALSGGRTAYWNEASQTVLIHNPAAGDLGTFFRPLKGIEYFLNLK